MSQKKRWLISFFTILAAFTLLVQGFGFVKAQKDPQQLLDEITKLETEVVKLKSQANTLKNQIAQFDAQIYLTGLKIQETEERITLLGGRIDQLEVSLDSLSKAFFTRVNETYKMERLESAFIFIITSQDLSEAVIRYHYLKLIQEADRNLLVRLQTAQNTYQEEKTDQEVLQEELEEQRSVLASQKAAKADLLAITRNDEKKYQQLLAQARAEYEAIIAITAGKGEETEVGKINQGNRIASIIQKASCNSSGPHLHFIVSENGTTHNPFSQLKPVAHENCSGPGKCSPADTFNPSGSWEWPINPTIRFTQGYGYTWAVQNTWVGRIYQFHNGIDVDSNDMTVRAVKNGTLFQGSYSGFGGCALKYVRVKHDDSNLDTFYLHINY